MASRNPCCHQSDIRYCIWLYLCGSELPCRTSDVGGRFGLSVYQARYYLLQLCRENKVRQLNAGKGNPALWLSVKPARTVNKIPPS
ncbi:TPA: hypothetical protein ON570_004107 [Citrobacter werkmanii]|nr:hypothetical protein [Citrobacter werkmanii]